MTAAATRLILERFYEALARRDAATMSALYAPDAAFTDPVFRLRGADIGRMWTSLLGRARDFSVDWEVRRADPQGGEVAWTARYLFGGKRRVVNVIESELKLVDGLIVEQNDRFDFPRWSSQALGLPGRLFGRTAWFRVAVGRKALRGIAPRS